MKFDSPLPAFYIVRPDKNHPQRSHLTMICFPMSLMEKQKSECLESNRII